MGRKKGKSKPANESTQPSDNSNIKTKGNQPKDTTEKRKKTKIKENNATGEKGD